MGAGRTSAASLVAAFWLLVPSLAAACPVCGGGNPANRFAFFASTIVLSLIPLSLFAIAFLWLRARIQAQARDEFRDRDDDALAARSERVR